jgi:hypothetical protein
MGSRQSRNDGMDPFSSLHYLEDSRHVMLMRSRKKNQGMSAPYLPREDFYPSRTVSSSSLVDISDDPALLSTDSP